MKKIILSIVSILIFLALIFAGIVIYLQLPVKTFEYAPGVTQFKVVTPIVAIGGEFAWEANVCRYSDKAFISTREFVNLDSGVHYDSQQYSTQTSIPVGQCQKLVRSITVPSYVIPGDYYMNFVVISRINRWNLQKIEFKTEDFKIINPQIDEGINK